MQTSDLKKVIKTCDGKFLGKKYLENIYTQLLTDSCSTYWFFPLIYKEHLSTCGPKVLLL